MFIPLIETNWSIRCATVTARIAVLLTRSNELSLVEAFWIRIENIYNNKNPLLDCPSFFDFGFAAILKRAYCGTSPCPLIPIRGWYITTCTKYFIALQNWYIQFSPDAFACEYDFHPFTILVPSSSYFLWVFLVTLPIR